MTILIGNFTVQQLHAFDGFQIKVTNMSNAVLHDDNSPSWEFVDMPFMKFTEAAGGDHLHYCCKSSKHGDELRRCRMTFLLVIFQDALTNLTEATWTAIVFAAYL